MLRKLIYSILAGISISIGGIIYLFCSNKIVGAVLFSVGILMVMEFKFLLFTGYVPTKREEQRPLEYAINCLFVLVGNIIGTGLTAGLILLTRQAENIKNAASLLVDTKLNDNLLSVLILSILCGFIIAMIVKAKDYKKQVLYSLMMIAVFILSGFEHVVADAFYLFATLQIFTFKGLLFLLVCGVGNFIGGFASSFISEPKEITLIEK